jgi:hypothetical protein
MKKIICSSLLYALISSSSVFAENPTTVNEPVTLPSKQVQWLSRSHLNISSDDVGHKDRKAAYRIYASETGDIQQVDVVESSGLSTLDEKVKNSILRSKFKPYIENDTAYPFVVVQPFSFQVLEDTRPWWKKFFGIH